MLRTLSQSKYQLQAQQSHYETLEIDEFWTFVGNKQNKQWLIYAYHRETGEIVAYIWGKRDLATAKRLKARLKAIHVYQVIVEIVLSRPLKSANKGLVSFSLSVLKAIIVGYGIGSGEALEEAVTSPKSLRIISKPLI